MTLPEQIRSLTKHSSLLLCAAVLVIGISLGAVWFGDRSGVTLGLTAIAGVLAATLIVRSLVDLYRRLAEFDEDLSDVSRQLKNLQTGCEAIDETIMAADEPAEVVMDLTAVGRGRPDLLTAATLDRSLFPRLSEMMETTASAMPREDDPGTLSTAAATRNLMRQWKVGLRNADLASCRRVYAALVEMESPETISAMRMQLDALTRRVEQALRHDFSTHVQHHNYLGMLMVGDEIRRLLPDQPVSRDFARLRPHLLQRLTDESRSSPPPAPHRTRVAASLSPREPINRQSGRIHDHEKQPNPDVRPGGGHLFSVTPWFIHSAKRIRQDAPRIYPDATYSN